MATHRKEKPDFYIEISRLIGENYNCNMWHCVLFVQGEEDEEKKT